MTETIQMVGRLFRDAPGKEHVQVHHLLQCVLDGNVDVDGVRADFNDFLKSVFAAMLLECVIHPVRLPSPPSVGGGQSRPHISPLLASCVDETECHRVMGELRDRMVVSLSDDPSLRGDPSRLSALFGSMVEEVLGERGIEPRGGYTVKDIADYVWSTWRRWTDRVKTGIDVSHIDIDLVGEGCPLDFMLYYASPVFGSATFREFREAMGKHVFLPFGEAREYVRGLGLKSRDKYYAWAKSCCRPGNIPYYPEKTYRGKGWIDFEDWLGNIYKKEFLPFAEAREYVRGLGLKNVKAYQAWSKSGCRPENIPSSPGCTYRSKGWIGWGDWLGTCIRRRKRELPSLSAICVRQ